MNIYVPNKQYSEKIPSKSAYGLNEKAQIVFDLQLQYPSIKYILTHRLNQDLENLFCQIRTRERNDHPSPIDALNQLRMIILGKSPGIVQNELKPNRCCKLGRKNTLSAHLSYGGLFEPSPSFLGIVQDMETIFQNKRKKFTATILTEIKDISERIAASFVTQRIFIRVKYLNE
ncbi:hypothetical protein PR048_002569, partial [Dryococelus australis]